MVDSEDDADEYDLEFDLLSLTVEGNCSLKRMQQLCKKIVNTCDGVPEHVKEIAALASSQPSHLERDLHTWINRQPWRHMLPDSYDFMLPCSNDGGLTMSERLHSVICPHETLGALYKEPLLFEELFGSRALLEEFWRKSPSEWVQAHPIPEVTSDPRHALPYGIFGDDSGLFKTDKFLVLLWGGVANGGLPSLDNKLLYGVLEARYIPRIH